VARAARLLLVRPRPYTVYDGEVAAWGSIYVRSTLPSSVWTYSSDDRQSARDGVGACRGDAGRRPAPSTAAAVLSRLAARLYVESCVAEPSPDVNRRTCSETVARGDFNHAAACRTETSRTERTDLTQLVRQPTRGNNVLSTASYELSSLLLSLITKAVLLCAEQKPVPRVKSTSKMTFRQLTPKQHALFLEHISTITLDTGTFSSGTVRAQFDYF